MTTHGTTDHSRGNERASGDRGRLDRSRPAAGRVRAARADPRCGRRSRDPRPARGPRRGRRGQASPSRWSPSPTASPDGAPRQRRGRRTTPGSPWSPRYVRRRGFGALPLVVGGRSNGARVACRTADRLGAAGVVALAFPLHPPGRPETQPAGRARGGRLPRSSSCRVTATRSACHRPAAAAQSRSSRVPTTRCARTLPRIAGLVVSVRDIHSGACERRSDRD